LKDNYSHNKTQRSTCFVVSEEISSCLSCLKTALSCNHLGKRQLIGLAFIAYTKKEEGGMRKKNINAVIP
jgi:hypothetical protein